LYVGVDLTVPFPLLIAPMPSYSNEPSLYIHPYSQGTDYSLVTNLLSNDLYAAHPSHPSQRRVGSLGIPDSTLHETNDVRQANYVYADSRYSVKTYFDAIGKSKDSVNTTGFSEIGFLPAFGTVPYEAALTGTGHHWAWATCEWLTHCNASVDYPGSACNVTKNAMIIEGYCFTSDTDSLECGRMVDTTDKFNRVTRVTSSTARCPRGSPATGLGNFVSKRLLVGGCMLTSDANYSSHAEVHVPQMCNTPANYLQGCMFPGATNYDPLAVQPTNCHYNIKGCTSSVAVNYNSEAYVDDGSCITAVYGCTVQSTSTSYANVANNTPSYQQRYVGLPLRSVGHYIYDAYPAVLNYDAAANVNKGCIVAIEGCTDSNSVNYDSRANINSVTWCVPVVVGCMMPTYHAASYNFRGSGYKSHDRDGGAANYDPAATVHDQASCIVERYGCMDSLAFNYDSRATVNWKCYSKQSGCLDDASPNFNCSKFGFDSGDPPVYTAYTTPCTDNWPRVTTHDSTYCTNTQPPSPPPVSLRGGGRIRMTVTFPVDGSLEDFGPAQQAAILASYIATMGPTFAGATIAATGGSVNLGMSNTVQGSGGFATSSAAVNNQFSSLSSINNALGVNALALPSISAEELDAEDDVALIVGATVGGVVGGILLIALVYVIIKRKGKKVEA